MKEEYLHYLFRTKQLGSQFTTTKNKVLNVLKFGHHNHNSGPDFLEGQVQLDDKIWAGQIEFHVKSSDWLKHKHQFDKNYNNVIAHFVYEHDLEIESGNYILPTVEIKSLIDQNHYKKYTTFIQSKNWVACQNDIPKVDEFVVYQQKEKALLNRLNRKSQIAIDLIEDFNGDRKKAFNILLFKAFGTKVNQVAFENLGRRFDWKIILKLNNDITKIEAYLFGLAGFLNESLNDEYFNLLKKEFNYLKSMFGLTEMKAEEWKYSAMRPNNLPTVRLAQLAKLFAKDFVISNLSALGDIKSQLNFDLEGYWQKHYMFNRLAKKNNPGLTNDFIELLIINVFVPYFFAVGRMEDNEELKERTFDWLSELNSEKNSITNNWKKSGVKSQTAFDSQALIEQKNEFCAKNLCLQCKVGLNLLK